MLILGLDVATSCGHALIERPGLMKGTRCGAWRSEGENGEEKAGELAMMVYDFVKAERPHFVAIEMPMRNVKSFTTEKEDMAGSSEEQTINPNALQLSALAGGVVAMLNAFKTPWGLIAPATWRKAYFGKGFVPPKKWVKKYDRRFQRKVSVEVPDWKQAAINQARIEGVPMPTTKAEQIDAADAVGIAVAWEGCTFIPVRHQKAFMALRAGSTRAAE